MQHKLLTERDWRWQASTHILIGSTGRFGLSGAGTASARKIYR